jgi:Na+-driven multidrug efflux pump
VAFYLIGLPCAGIFCFMLNWGVTGLLMGIAVGTLFQVVTLVSLLSLYETSIFTPYITVDA